LTSLNGEQRRPAPKAVQSCVGGRGPVGSRSGSVDHKKSPPKRA
jgi:hypothetical protein